MPTRFNFLTVLNKLQKYVYCSRTISLETNFCFLFTKLKIFFCKETGNTGETREENPKVFSSRGKWKWSHSLVRAVITESVG